VLGMRYYHSCVTASGEYVCASVLAACQPQLSLVRHPARKCSRPSFHVRSVARRMASAASSSVFTRRVSQLIAYAATSRQLSALRGAIGGEWQRATEHKNISCRQQMPFDGVYVHKDQAVSFHSHGGAKYTASTDACPRRIPNIAYHLTPSSREISSSNRVHI